MSKGNMFLGGARGSVGDVTLQVLNGQQITKRRNRNPKNPKTKKQMYQRASFAEPVKFFTRGQQNLFRFAFENKANGESDYNAFMRVNAKLGVLMTKQQIESPFVAKIGNFCLTMGSLTGISAESFAFSPSESAGGFGVKTSLIVDTLPTTFGELSTAILDGSKGLQNGDIITLLCIDSDNGITDEPPYLTTDNEYEPVWTIEQFIINTADATPLTAAWTLYKDSDNKLLIINGNVSTVNEVCGAALIISRNIPGGVKVSTSYIKISPFAQQAVDLMKPNFIDPDFDTPWAAKVLASWSAADNAVLQGSLAAKPTVSQPIITKVAGGEIPSIISHGVNKTGLVWEHEIEGSGLFGLDADKFTVTCTLGPVSFTLIKQSDSLAGIQLFNNNEPYTTGETGVVTITYEKTLLASHTVTVL